MNVESLIRLYVRELNNIYSVEQQLLQAIPRAMEYVSDDTLRVLLAKHLRETEKHWARLEEICLQFDFLTGNHKCTAMASLIAEGEEAIREQADPADRDAMIIANYQRIEHYEIATYGTACAYAEKLRRFDQADLLDRSLQEERVADRKLSRLAMRIVGLDTPFSPCESVPVSNFHFVV